MFQILFTLFVLGAAEWYFHTSLGLVLAPVYEFIAHLLGWH